MNLLDTARRLVQLGEVATPGDWTVSELVVPIKGGGAITAREVVTAWEHGQLKGPASITPNWLSIAPDGKVQRYVSLSPGDAAFIATARSADRLAAALLEAEALMQRMLGETNVLTHEAERFLASLTAKPGDAE